MIDRDSAVDALRAEGLDVTEWRDEPGSTYAAHAHPQREVRIILQGTITFVVDGEAIELGPGDRLDLAPMQEHSAVVGPDGVHYLAGTAR